MDATDQKRIRDNLHAEVDGASFYRTLAQIEDGSELAIDYTSMTEAEERNADIPRFKPREAGVAAVPTQPGRSTRTLIALRRCSPARVMCQPADRTREIRTHGEPEHRQ